MSRVGTILLAVAGVLAIAPWAVFLAGIAKLTDVFNSNNDSVWLRQQAYMLEWYEIWMELAVIVVIIVLGAANVPRAASFLQMWLAVNTALIIYSATDRLIAINAINDDGTYGQYTSNNLVALRCTVAGQISTAFWNFVMSIILAVSGALVSDSASASAKSGAAEATATAA